MANIINKIFGKKDKNIAIIEEINANIYLNILIKDKLYYCKYDILQIKNKNGELKCLAKMTKNNIDKKTIKQLQLQNSFSDVVILSLDNINRYKPILKCDMPVGMACVTLQKWLDKNQKKQIKTIHKNIVSEYLTKNN